MQLEKAFVEYPTKDTPYEGNYGPSFSIGLIPENDGLHRVNEKGILNIWKKEGSAQANFMQTLAKGDAVNIIWTEPSSGRQGYWAFIIPKGGITPPTAQSPAPTPLIKQSQSTWLPYTDDELNVLDVMMAEEIQIISHMGIDRVGELIEAASTDDKIRIAITAYINAKKSFCRGMALAASASLDKDAYVNAVKAGGSDVMQAVLQSICIYAKGYKSIDEVIEVFKKVGLSSDMIKADDHETWITALDVADEFMTIRSSGADDAAAAKYVAELLNVDDEKSDIVF
jgi:hypothetical protein